MTQTKRWLIPFVRRLFKLKYTYCISRHYIDWYIKTSNQYRIDAYDIGDAYKQITDIVKKDNEWKYVKVHLDFVYREKLPLFRKHR